MKAPFSPYLDSIAPALKKIVDALSGSFDYVSVLSSDSVGFTMRIGQKSKSVSEENLTTERGSVIRVCRGGLYSEYAFNTLDAACPERTAEEILSALSSREEMLRALDVRSYRTPVLEDRPLKLREEFECGILPEEADRGDLVRRFTALSDEGVKAREGVIDCMASLSSTHISKLFMTPNRDLRQSYVYSEGGVALLGAENGAIAERCTVFGRIRPEQKQRLVKAWQKKGKTVAMGHTDELTYTVMARNVEKDKRPKVARLFGLNVMTFVNRINEYGEVTQTARLFDAEKLYLTLKELEVEVEISPDFRRKFPDLIGCKLF